MNKKKAIINIKPERTLRSFRDGILGHFVLLYTSACSCDYPTFLILRLIFRTVRGHRGYSKKKEADQRFLEIVGVFVCPCLFRSTSL